jgi:hypothetical protein
MAGIGPDDDLAPTTLESVYARKRANQVPEINNLIGSHLFQFSKFAEPCSPPVHESQHGFMVQVLMRVTPGKRVVYAP